MCQKEPSPKTQKCVNVAGQRPATDPSPKTHSLRFVNRDLLKYIALILMGTGHMIMFTVLGRYPIRSVPLGRFFLYAQMFAPPVFFFFISEGFRYTRSKKDYAIRLGAIALITQVPFYLCEYSSEPIWRLFTVWNVMASLFAGLLVLMVWESGWKLWLRIPLMAGIVFLTWVLHAEWMITGPILIFVMYVLREKNLLRYFVCILILFFSQIVTDGFQFSFRNFGWQNLLFEVLAMTVITFFYNGEKGRFPKFSKWLFYVFYPAHLLVGYLVQIILG